MEEGKLPIIKLPLLQITAATWNNNYDEIIATAKRNRDEKYASLPKAKRN